MRIIPALPLAAVVASLLLAALPAAQAQWAVYAEVVNECSETITVDFSTGDTYILAYNETAIVTLCESFCVGFLGACKEYSWSYSAESTSLSWSDVSHYA